MTISVHTKKNEKQSFHILSYAVDFDSKFLFISQINNFLHRLQECHPFNILHNAGMFSVYSLFNFENNLGSSEMSAIANIKLAVNKTTRKIDINFQNLSKIFDKVKINNISDSLSVKQILQGSSQTGMQCLLVILFPSQSEGGFENEFERKGDDDFYCISTSCDGQWEQVILRSVCRLMRLGDEFELDGSDFEKPPIGVGELYSYFHPNLLYSDTPNSSIPAADTKWGHLSNKIGFDFPIRRAPSHPGQADLSIPTHNFLPNNIELWEGGGGYRTHIYRSAHDCLMRRQIGNKNLPVREAVVPLCPVCAAYVQQQILAWGQENRVRSLEFRGFIQQL